MSNSIFSSILSSDHLAIETLSQLLDGQTDQTANNLYANASILSIGNSSVYTYLTPSNISTYSFVAGNDTSNVTIDPVSFYLNSSGLTTFIGPFSASFSGMISGQNGLYISGPSFFNGPIFANNATGADGQVYVSNGAGQYWSNSVNNALNLGGVPSYFYVNSSADYTISGIHTHSANIVIGNSSVNAIMFANSSNVYFTGISYNANNSNNLDGQPSTYYAANSILSSYQTLAGMASNVVTLTANNSNYLGGVSASEYMLLTTLPGLQTKAALPADVHKLTANSSDYLGDYAANQYAFANVIPTLQTKAALSTDVHNLTANNSDYLGGVAATWYPNKYSNAIITGVYNHLANVQIRAALWANGASGTVGQVLASDANGNVFWQTTNGQSISVNNLVVTGSVTANAFAGDRGLVLTSNGHGGVYWSDVTNASGGIFDGGSPLSSYINNPRLDAGGVY
jgi:hypothetical protein